MTSLISFVVPDGVESGDTVTLSVQGKPFNITIPASTTAGDTLQFSLPPAELAPAEGPSYTSGEDDDDASGPALLTPSQYNARHPNPSQYRRHTRPFRVHYFHNQQDGKLCTDATFSTLIDSPIDSPLQRIPYSDVASPAQGFDTFAVGGVESSGVPVVLTQVPGAAAVMSHFTPQALCQPHTLNPDTHQFKELLKEKALIRSIQVTTEESGEQQQHEKQQQQEHTTTDGLGNVPVRVCHPFAWGQTTISGRLSLVYYFMMLGKHPNADVPFYVFENSIGGNRHTAHSYSAVDQWVHSGNASREENASSKQDDVDDDDEPRKSIAALYAIPVLFQQHCMLQVPYELRPRSTDGVLLVGSRRSGSYPHVDPTYTAAWNWLLHGEKRWVLFPPHVSLETVVGSSSSSSSSSNALDSEEFYKVLATKGSGYWWAEHYPRLKLRQKELGMVEILQKPGEIIYVPMGWWHAVINVSKWTVAVTHNIILPSTLVPAFRCAVKDDPLFARRWWRCLKRFTPQHSDRIPKELVQECIVRSNSLLQSNYGKTIDCDDFSPTLARIDDELMD